jgi:RNA polymerase sigma factor (sigma-70 family)
MIDPPDPPDGAFHAAVDQCWTSVYRFALSMTNDLADAEDVTQESFTRLWVERDRVDWDRPILGWLLVVARRIALDRWRRVRRAVRLAPALAAPAAASVDASLVEEFVDLRAQLGRLSATERASILMVAVEGLSPAEVGAALGISAGAVRAAASRGRSKLDAWSG